MRIADDAGYRRATRLVDELVDAVGNDEHHPLFDLLDTLGTLVHAYEEEHHPMPAGSPAEVVEALMTEHGLHRKDLPEIGTQGVVSEILRGKRALNTRQIKALAERFGVSPSVFF